MFWSFCAHLQRLLPSAAGADSARRESSWRRAAQRSVALVKMAARGLVALLSWCRQGLVVIATGLWQTFTAPFRALGRGGRAILAEWRHFFRDNAYKPYRRQSLAAGGVAAFSGPGLALPLLLVLGMSGAGATAVLVALVAGPAMQIAVPTMLRRSGGRLRRLTLVLIAAGDTVGLWVAPVLLGVALLGWSLAIGLVAVSTAIIVSGFASGTGYGNLGVWFRIVLPEGERRFVAPRTAGVSTGVAAAVLLPVAIGLDPVSSFLASNFGGISHVAVLPFALLYALGGLCGLIELAAIAALPSPGRVLPAKGGVHGPKTPELARFLQVATFAAVGSGLGPYLSVYAMTVLHASAGYAVSLSAAAAGVSILASSVVAAALSRRSSSRMLRLSYTFLGVGYLVALAAHPLLPGALLILACANLIIAAGGTITRLALNERFFRLLGQADPMSASARFLGGTSAGAAAGQTVGVGVLALGPVAYLTYAALFVAAGLSRLVAAKELDVSPSWRSAINERFARRAAYLAEQAQESESQPAQLV
jgi:hypothetical protein